MSTLALRAAGVIASAVEPKPGLSFVTRLLAAREDQAKRARSRPPRGHGQRAAGGPGLHRRRHPSPARRRIAAAAPRVGLKQVFSTKERNRKNHVTCIDCNRADGWRGGCPPRRLPARPAGNLARRHRRGFWCHRPVRSATADCSQHRCPVAVERPRAQGHRRRALRHPAYCAPRPRCDRPALVTLTAISPPAAATRGSPPRCRRS